MFHDPSLSLALIAGSGIALACGLVGYFLVLRAQVFTGDALSHVAFTGALAALAFGVDPRVGLFAGCVLIAVLFGALGRRGRADDVVIGSVFAWVLGLGVFFVTLYTTNQSGSGGAGGDQTVSVLFGSILGLSTGRAATAVVIGLAVSVVMVLIARPLLFATLDEAVAAARGVPVRLLGYGFLVLIGVTAGEASQAVGSMLLLGLLAAPAGTALLLTDRPFVGMALSAVLGVIDVWAGVTVSHFVPKTPTSFWIMAVAGAVYAVALGYARIRPRLRTGAPGESSRKGAPSRMGAAAS
jgi:zinc/manganese transport system permease protein